MNYVLLPVSLMLKQGVHALLLNTTSMEVVFLNVLKDLRHLSKMAKMYAYKYNALHLLALALKEMNLIVYVY